MTIAEWHISFKQGLDKFDSGNYPNLEPEEIDLLFNQATGIFVKQRYGFTNIKKESFEETQKRTEDLKTLVRTAVLNPIANNNNNINSDAVFVTLPTDHWITIQELANVTYPDCNGDNVTEDVYVLPIQHNDYTKLISNPFGKPTDGKVLRLVTEQGVELIPSTTSTVNNYRLRYIKEPIKVNLSTSTNSDLTSMVHQEIIDIAISLALENIEAKRVQTYIPLVENRHE